MTREFVLKKTFEVISRVQSDTKVTADHAELVYLMGFNDGALMLAEELFKSLTETVQGVDE